MRWLRFEWQTPFKPDAVFIQVLFFYQCRLYRRLFLGNADASPQALAIFESLYCSLQFP